jgi:UPF0755 protein
VSDNWSQGGSGGPGEDPYARPEPAPEGGGRGRRRAGGPPPDGAARQPDPRSRPQRPQDPYAAGAPDPAYGNVQPGPGGQSRYGLGSYDASPFGSSPYSTTAHDSGSYPTGSYGAGPDSGAQYPAGRSAGPGRPPAEPRVLDPFATGGQSAGAGAPPRRGQPAQPGQPQRPAPGRPPFGAAAQPPRTGYGRDPYDTGSHGAGPEAGYDSGSYETGQFDRRQSERPPYDRAQRDRGAQGYDRQPYESQASERRPYDADSYDQAPYRDEPRSAGAGGRRRAAGPVEPDPDPDFDEYARDEFDPEPPTRSRSRRRSTRRDEEVEEDFQLIDDEHDDGDDSGGGRSGRKPKQPKRGRNCLAVFVAFAVLAGGLGYGGYRAYQWYEGRNSEPADYTATSGTELIDVVIPGGAGGTEIGQILYKADVIKSEGAFINACAANPQCPQIQANTYLVPKEISAASAVTLLLNPTNVDEKGLLTTYGGERAQQIFASLEKKKGWSDASVVAAMNSGKIDLPSWDTAKAGAKFPYAPIEGFICAEQYELGSYSTPQALLKKMVDDQLSLLTTQNFAAKAQTLGVTEYQLLTIASMAQAEAANANDLPNIAEVVFNRLKDTADFQHLGFDTVTLYGLGNTVTTPTAADLRDTTNPYNTHLIDGLPPSPIGNPDTAALTAAANPAQTKNVYFCAINSTTTLYATDNSQWADLGRQYPDQCGGG